MELAGLHYHHPAYDPDYYRLYTKAGEEQWSIGSVAWDQLGDLDADWRQGMLNLLSPLLVSERGAMQACGTMIPACRAAGHHDAELVMHAMMLDEARHWEGLNRFFVETRGEPIAISEYKEMLGIQLLIMRGASFDQWLWAIQICDIIAGNLYNAFKASCDSRPIVDLFAGFLRDEARHHKFCQLYFERQVQTFTDEQKQRYREHGRRLVGKFEKIILGRMRDDLVRIGADPQKMAQKISVTVERQADQYGLA